MASDGSIKISIEVDGKEVKVASKELDTLEASAGSVGKGIKSAESSMDGLADSSDKAGKSVKGAKESIDGVGQGTTKASISLKDLAVSLGLVAVASAAFNTLKASVDGAIARFDTLNTFPKVLEALGVSAEDSERAINDLSEGIDGLPTTLDDISSSAQQMYNSFKDIDKTTDTALALNNALLASGSAGEAAKRGTDQYIKALQTGQINMDTWNTLQETMGIGLTKLAEEFGYAGASAENDLYKALQNGEVTFDQFNSKLIELGTGTGELAELAKTNSLGIATSLGNLKNAAARGIADIIASFDRLSKEVTGKDIAQNIDALKHIVNASFKAIGSAIEGTAPAVKLFASAIGALLPIVKPLTPALIGLAAAYAMHTTVNTLTAAMKANATVMAVITAAQNTYTIATNRMTLALTLAAVRTKATGVALAAYNSLVTLSTTIQAAFTSGMSLASIAAVGLSGAISILGTAIKVLMGPVGWVTLAIGALVGATVGIVKWFNRSSEEGERLSGEIDKLSGSTDELLDSVESSSKAYEENRNELESTAATNQKLATEIEALADKEQKSASEKELLKSKIDELNGSVEGLSLSYNEEAESLNLSSEELRARLELTKEQASYTEALERQVEIAKEQHEIVSKLHETNALREELNQLYENGSKSTSEYKSEVAELDEQEEELRETLKMLSIEYQETEGQIELSMEAIAEAVENGAAAQVVSFEMLSESNQQMVEDMKAAWEEYKDAATDMFDTLSDESTHTVEQMQANLEENQRIIGEWAEGIATLAERGIDEGLLETLREAGPESAGHVNALVNASDEELQRLSETFSDGGKVATDALSESLGIEESGVLEVVGHLVTGTKKALSDKVQEANFTEIGVDIATGQAEGMEEGIPDIEEAGKNMAKAAEDATRKESETNSPSRVFERIGIDQADGLALGITNGTPEVIAAAKKLATETLKQFNDLPAEFRGIGNDSMAGFNNGLVSRSGEVLATARNIANNVARTMKSALRIHSPSKVTTQIGEDTGEGLKRGISNKEQVVSATSKKMANVVIDLIDKMHKEIKLDTTQHNQEIKQIERRAKEDIQLIHAKASDAKRKITKAEAIRVQRITEDSNKKIKSIEEKVAKEREKIAVETNKTLMAEAEKYVTQQKRFGGMSLKEEGHFWNQMYRNAERGSEEYEKAMQNHQSVVKRMRDQMESANEAYSKRIVEIDEKLVEDTKRLNEEYSAAYQSRLDDLLGFSGLFDEFVENEDVTGQKLTDNLLSQVQALQEFTMTIQSLETKIDNAELFAELEAMGPSAVAELKALNNMSAQELEKFINLYQQKFNLARNQTIKELEPVKKDVTKRIQALNKATQKELEIVKKEWIDSINEIVLGTEEEFDSMRQVGIDAAEGLEKGLLSRESSLMRTAKRIADSVQETIKSALDIHSPSRLMRDEIGKMIPAGIALGIEDNAKSVYNALKDMSGQMMITASPEVALGTGGMHRINMPGTAEVGVGTTKKIGSKQNNESIQIENILMVDGYEMGRLLSDTISTEQAGKYSVRSIVKGGG